MNEIKLDNYPWWAYLPSDLQELLKESFLLYRDAENWTEKFHDYAFIVFPAAKAYEGFLKSVFRDLNFITDEEFNGKKFRVGKALNPSLDRNRFKDESVYDKLVDFCQGEKLPMSMWEMWKKGRNLTFHWFPNEKNAITLEEAGEILNEILETMDMIFKGCKIEGSDGVNK